MQARRCKPLRAPWHALKKACTPKVTVKFMDYRGSDTICERRVSQEADLIDLMALAYNKDTHGRLGHPENVGDHKLGGLSSFVRMGRGKGRNYLDGHRKKRLRDILLPGHGGRIQLRAMTHEEFVHGKFLDGLDDELFWSQQKVPTGDATRLEMFDLLEEKEMEVATVWHKLGHVTGFFRYRDQSTEVTPLSQLPGGIERKWITVEVLPGKSRPIVRVRTCSRLPSSVTHKTVHPNLCFADISAAAVSASRGQYNIWHNNCQTFLLGLYRKLGLSEYANQFDNVLLRKGLQTEEKHAYYQSRHPVMARCPDKGALRLLRCKVVKLLKFW